MRSTRRTFLGMAVASAVGSQVLEASATVTADEYPSNTALYADPSLRPSAFTIRSVLARFEQADPWKDLRRRGRSLTRARRRLDTLAGGGG